MKASKYGLDDVRRQLSELEARKQVLERLLCGYEQLAKLGPTKRDIKPKGSISLRGAVLQVIKEAGSAIKPADIWIRAQALGAASEAKKPIQIVDLTACQLRRTEPLKKTSEGWLYTG